jgi:aspartyl-tRNA(Asn)/glutamyl-tRNA(Gln) amidotransferase subunit A
MWVSSLGRLDSAFFLDVLAGRDNHDSTSSFKPVETYEEENRATRERVKDRRLKEITDSITKKKLKDSFLISSPALKRKAFKLMMSNSVATFWNRSMRPISSSAAPKRPATTRTSMGLSSAPIMVARLIKRSCITREPKGFSELIKRRFVIGSYCPDERKPRRALLTGSKNRAKIVERSTRS